MLGEWVVSLLEYFDGKMAKYTEPSITGSYVEWVRSRTHAKVPEIAEVAERLDLRALSERDCESLWFDIENARKTTIDLRDRLESSRVVFNEESRCIDELTADLAKRNHLHGAELAAKAKELTHCEAARTLELEHK
ncbi:hypothetical protein AXG93_2490s1390 [Marchantia polymorpha subsp. ruderalis]|uniref:Uncharacterized protein n=1 Tax=Marchantia polymorpha subsp. ruderalis TaxID=1480154 RepID=A0A176W5N4_MARPO|nr:hypothetical protein AXG93_2490s1390 [Marchantia polymorpha subsp. ruderalis]